MSNYYIYAILLKGCPYSDKALNLLKTNNIKREIITITSENKEKFKMENYYTYPQIFFKKDDSIDSLFLGGYSDLQKCIDIFKNSNTENFENNIKDFQNNYNWWSRKAILRLIQLINHK